MWNVSHPSLSVAHLGPIIPMKVLYHFDGPMLFTATMGFSNMLFFKFDEIEGNDLFLATVTDEKIVDALERGALSVRGALGFEDCFVVETTVEGQIQKYWPTSISQLDEEMLPEFGVGLDPSASWVVDAIEQLDSYFSVRFSGDGLSRDTIAFRTFMTLMDSVYEAARGVLAPTGLEKARSSVFDFNIKEPVFGSLIVTIDEPSANLEKVKKYMNRKDVTNDDLMRGFEQSRDSLFDGLAGLAEADPAHLDVQQNAARYALIKKLVELLPNEDSSFTKVEFNSFSSAGVRHVQIEKEKATALREEHVQASQSTEEFLGTITIINDKSATFVVMAEFGREVTCRLSRSLFETLQEDERFGTKALVRIYGSYSRRPRRDEISVHRMPEIIDRQ